MKTTILSVTTVCTLFSLIGCNNRTEVEVLQPTRATELKPMQRSWHGILPCADCEGIETSLFLGRDGAWVMNECHQGVRNEPSSFASYGTWAHATDKLVLADSKGERSYYRAKDEALEVLDREGNPIKSRFDYTLQPVSASLPMTSMPMRDMCFYTADAATFTGYTTGKRTPVADNTRLGYDCLAARAENGQSVLLAFEAHFILESSPDTGEKVKMLMADKGAKFILGKAYN